MGKALIVTDKKKLLVRDEHPTRITAVIPTSKIVNYRGVDLVVMPHDLDEVRVLNNMGYNVQSPVSHYYKYSGRYTPFHAQKVTTDKMTLNQRMFVLNQIGTGKTLATLWAYDYLRSVGRARKMLIVTPLSTMERVWADEVFRHFPHLRCQVLYGTAKRRVSQLEFPAEIYVINHDGLKVPEIREALIANQDIDVVAVDELASFRNAGTDRWKALKRVIENRAFVWGLTGTPIPNRPTDAWAQCRLIAPHRVSPYFSRFREMVERKVSNFKWVPRDNALQTVQEAMQPSVLFRRDECVDLPPTTYEYRYVEMSTEQKQAYKQMVSSLVAEAKAGQIVAVNEAVKAQKLSQIACIAKNTPVLSRRGWVPIQSVTAEDEVWDGVEWVSQGGTVRKGVSVVVECGGVRMTADHQVLSTSGWISAKEMNDGDARGRFDWEEVRLPDGGVPAWVNFGGDEMRDMGMRVRLRERSSTKEPVSAVETPYPSQELRLPPRERNTQDVDNPPLQCVDEDEVQVLLSVRQRLEKLRWAWDNCVQRVAGLPDFLGRRAQGLRSRYVDRQDQQLAGVLEVELQMGDSKAAGEQPPVERTIADAGRRNDVGTSGGTLWSASGNPRGEDRPIRVVSGACIDDPREEVEVFDLVNCGPRNRFVVRGSDGQLRIVHNCGVAYDQDGNCVQFDCQNRIAELEDIVTESGSKVIVFVPLTGGLEMVAAALAKKWPTAVVHGGVGKTDRDRIFGEFQTPGGLHILVAHPKCMSHGLTLVEASTIVWFIPTNNHEDYEQANGRITRPGQKRNTLIMHIEGSDIERRMYKRLETKSSMQNLLLDMIKEEFDEEQKK